MDAGLCHSSGNLEAYWHNDSLQKLNTVSGNLQLNYLVLPLEPITPQLVRAKSKSTVSVHNF